MVEKNLRDFQPSRVDPWPRTGNYVFPSLGPSPTTRHCSLPLSTPTDPSNAQGRGTSTGTTFLAPVLARTIGARDKPLKDCVRTRPGTKEHVVSDRETPDSDKVCRHAPAFPLDGYFASRPCPLNTSSFVERHPITKSEREDEDWRQLVIFLVLTPIKGDTSSLKLLVSTPKTVVEGTFIVGVCVRTWFHRHASGRRPEKNLFRKDPYRETEPEHGLTQVLSSTWHPETRRRNNRRKAEDPTAALTGIVLRTCSRCVGSGGCTTTYPRYRTPEMTWIENDVCLSRWPPTTTSHPSGEVLEESRKCAGEPRDPCLPKPTTVRLVWGENIKLYTVPTENLGPSWGVIHSSGQSNTDTNPCTSTVSLYILHQGWGSKVTSLSQQ